MSAHGWPTTTSTRRSSPRTTASNYYSGFLFCYFGRKYGLVVDQDDATTITAAIDGGQPWRRSHGDNITYTDWRKDNYFRAVQQLTKGVKRVGIEFDHVHLDFRGQLEDAMPGVEFVDIGQPSMRMRSIKSAEEHDLIREGARICDIGGAACVDGHRRGRTRARGRDRVDQRHDPRDRQQVPLCGADGHLDMVPVGHQHGRRP